MCILNVVECESQLISTISRVCLLLKWTLLQFGETLLHEVSPNVQLFTDCVVETRLSLQSCKQPEADCVYTFTFSEWLTKIFRNRSWPRSRQPFLCISSSFTVTSGCLLWLTKCPRPGKKVRGRSVCGHSWQHPEDVIIGTGCIFWFRNVTPNLFGCKRSARHLHESFTAAQCHFASLSSHFDGQVLSKHWPTKKRV